MACKPRLLTTENYTFTNNEEFKRTEKGDPANEEVSLDMLEALKEALRCPVCLEIFKNPVRVKGCLHQFCAQCIDDYTRKFKKNCPGCR